MGSNEAKTKRSKNMRREEVQGTNNGVNGTSGMTKNQDGDLKVAATKAKSREKTRAKSDRLKPVLPIRWRHRGGQRSVGSGAEGRRQARGPSGGDLGRREVV